MLELYIFIGIFGAIIGSFLNVVVIRYGTGRTVGGRSMCMSCGHTLSYKELVPIFSYIFLRGRCAHCGSRISPKYVLVEILTSAVFVVLLCFVSSLPLTLSDAATVFALHAVFWSIMIAIAVYDLRHTIIPDGLLVLSLIVTIITLVLGYGFHVGELALAPFGYENLLAGVFCALPFAFLWLISKGTWMGFGDAKLVFVLSTLLGLHISIAYIIMAFWAGAVIGIFLMILSGKKFGARTEVPFAPFLIASAFIVMVLSINWTDLIALVSEVIY